MSAILQNNAHDVTRTGITKSTSRRFSRSIVRELPCAVAATFQKMPTNRACTADLKIKHGRRNASSFREEDFQVLIVKGAF